MSDLPTLLSTETMQDDAVTATRPATPPPPPDCPSPSTPPLWAPRRLYNQKSAADRQAATANADVRPIFHRVSPRGITDLHTLMYFCDAYREEFTRPKRPLPLDLQVEESKTTKVPRQRAAYVCNTIAKLGEMYCKEAEHLRQVAPFADGSLVTENIELAKRFAQVTTDLVVRLAGTVVADEVDSKWTPAVYEVATQRAFAALRRPSPLHIRHPPDRQAEEDDCEGWDMRVYWDDGGKADDSASSRSV